MYEAFKLDQYYWNATWALPVPEKQLVMRGALTDPSLCVMCCTTLYYLTNGYHEIQHFPSTSRTIQSTCSIWQRRKSIPDCPTDS